MNLKQYMTITEASSYYSVSIRTIKRWVKAKKVESVKLPSNLLIKKNNSENTNS